MQSKGWTTTNLVVVGLSAALIVFFAGVTAAVAAGQKPPTAQWAAGSAISGALVGLLIPAPGPTAAHKKQAKEAEKKNEPAKAEEHALAAAKLPDTRWAIVLLFGVFVLSLAGGVLLATGMLVPPKEFVASTKSVTNAVIALASASGSALIGIITPSSDTGA